MNKCRLSAMFALLLPILLVGFNGCSEDPSGPEDHSSVPTPTPPGANPTPTASTVPTATPRPTNTPATGSCELECYAGPEFCDFNPTCEEDYRGWGQTYTDDVIERRGNRYRCLVYLEGIRTYHATGNQYEFVIDAIISGGANCDRVDCDITVSGPTLNGTLACDA